MQLYLVVCKWAIYGMQLAAIEYYKHIMMSACIPNHDLIMPGEMWRSASRLNIRSAFCKGACMYSVKYVCVKKLICNT